MNSAPEFMPLITYTSVFVKVFLTFYLLYVAFRYRSYLVGAVVFLGGISVYTSATQQQNEAIPLLISNVTAAVVVYVFYRFAKYNYNERLFDAGVKNHDLYLAQIVHSSDDAIIGKDLEGKILSWNRGAERLYGYTSDEVVGKNIQLLIPKDHPDEFEQIMTSLRDGQKVNRLKTQRVRKDGKVVEVELNISPIKTGDKIIGASVTARKLGEDSTKPSHDEKTRKEILKNGSKQSN